MKPTRYNKGVRVQDRVCQSVLDLNAQIVTADCRINNVWMRPGGREDGRWMGKKVSRASSTSYWVLNWEVGQ